MILGPPVRPVPSHRLLILACSATKRPEPDWAPAVERYNGPLWQTLRATDPEGQLAKVAALSARYGLIGGSTPIQHYDCRLTVALADQMKAGGIDMRWPPHSGARQAAPLGDSAATHIASLCSVDLDTVPFDDVAVVGGHRYVDLARHFIEASKSAGFIAPSSDIAIINGPIGLMRQALRTWLLNHPTGNCSPGA
ncbi:hypothetical protein GCM10019059_44600 [Camelimonas fluminis]|nr:hypothetical protein GCM10019059_44600 [Camelimonas fluminis]